jgi:carboxypeptidase family protein/BACON domain-containing protein
MHRLMMMSAAVLLLSTTAAGSLPKGAAPQRLKPSPLASGAISGRVVDENGLPLAGFAILVVTASDRSFVDSALTAADGTYSVPGLADGSYFVDAFNGDENRHVDTWYPNVWDTDFWRNLVAATPIVVSNGGTAVANFTLPFGARILLTLKDPSGAPIIVPPRKFGIHGCWGSMYVSVNGQPFEVNGACTGGHAFGDGTYEPYVVPKGRTYFLKAWPTGFPYAPVYYDNQPTLQTATAIMLTSEGPLPLTIRMGAVGHDIAGKYTFSTTQDQIVSAGATLYTANGVLQSIDVASDGTYVFRGLSDGDYVVQLRVSAVKSGKRAGYIKYYRNAADFATATRIAVRGNNLSGIDVVMDTPADAGALKTAMVSVSLVAASGTSSEPVSVPIWAESGEVSWTASGTSAWLRVAPPSGAVFANQGARSVSVSADASQLAAGSFTDTLTIAGNSGAALSIPVALQVTPAPLPAQPPLQVSASSILFVSQWSQFAPATLTLSNPGTAPLTWILRSPIVTAFPSTGTLEGGASVDVKIAANATGLGFGSLTGNIDVITNGQVTSLVAVSITVAPVPTAAERRALSDSQPPGSPTASAAPSVTLVLPSIGSNLPGAGGSLWSSDVFLTNLPSSIRSSLASFIFTPFGSTNGSNSLLVSGLVTAPMITLSSPIATLFRQTSGFGAIELRPASPIASWSRIWTFSSDRRGTYGQEVPAIDSQRTIGTGETGTIPVLLGGSSFRSNLLISEIRGLPADVTVTIRDGSGMPLKTLIVSLSPFEQKSVNNIISDTSATTAYAMVTVSGGGGVGVLASIVDNSTNDPTTVMMTKSAARTASGKLIVPGLVHAPGAGNTTWRSDVWIVNTSSTPVTFRPLLYPGGGAGSMTGRNHSMAPGAQVTMSDSILSDFSLDSGKGTLILDVTSGDASGIRMFSRTFNIDQRGGTLGQGILPVRSTDEIKLNDPGLTIFGLQRSCAFRSNLQIQETGGSPVSVEIRGEGTPPGLTVSTVFPSTTVNLSGYDLLQFSDILGLLGFPADTINAQLTLKVVSGSGSIMAYGSFIDNATGDATTVPAFKLQP